MQGFHSHFINIVGAGGISPEVADVKYLEYTNRWNLRSNARRGRHPVPKMFNCEMFDLASVSCWQMFIYMHSMYHCS